jgi:hypothetical protein
MISRHQECMFLNSLRTSLSGRDALRFGLEMDNRRTSVAKMVRLGCLESSKCNACAYRSSWIFKKGRKMILDASGCKSTTVGACCSGSCAGSNSLSNSLLDGRIAVGRYASVAVIDDTGGGREKEERMVAMWV